MKKMLILLPDGKIHKLKLPPFLEISFREAPLTATFLAALVPPELGFDIRVCDESVSRVPAEEHFDLVAVSTITGTAYRGYHWSGHFRKRGATVVIGGVHATLLPEEAQTHADSVVIGFAEQSFPQLCRDYAAGRLQRVYRQQPQPLTRLPRPRRDLQKKFGYMVPNTVFATRGCRNTCDFCAVVAARFGWHTRPVGEVIDEIRQLPGRRFCFNDVSLCEDREYALELLQALKPLKKTWGGLATTRITADAELMDALAGSGCCYMLFGFESINNAGLYSMRKAFNTPENYFNVCAAMHDRGLLIQGCFIFGLDEDTPEVFQNTVDAVNELCIDIPRYAVYTPFPGTEAAARLKREGRLLHEYWPYYDTQHVVIRPKQMTPAELDAGFIRAWRQTYSLASIRTRTSLRRKMYPVAFLGNLAYRLYIRRLACDTRRFPDGTEVRP